MPDREQVMTIPGVHWHDYGKSPRPGRKIGHATLTAGSLETLKTNALRVGQIAGGEFPALLRTLFE
jgi:5-(carboxyamino)imidazole ribonucleotide synthase